MCQPEIIPSPLIDGITIARSRTIEHTQEVAEGRLVLTEMIRLSPRGLVDVVLDERPRRDGKICDVVRLVGILFIAWSAVVAVDLRRVGQTVLRQQFLEVLVSGEHQ